MLTKVSELHRNSQLRSEAGNGCLQGRGELGMSYLVQTVAMPMLLAVLLLNILFKNGKKWVDRPQLCPSLAQPW
jgi:hypothetical protein